MFKLNSELKRNLKQYINIFNPMSNFLEKYRYRKECYFNGSGSIIKNTSFEGHNMIGKNVTLINCQLGEASYVNHNSRLIGSKIGKYCSIADNVYSGFGHHPLNNISTHSSFFYDTMSHLGWTWFETDSAPKYDPYKHPNNENVFVTEIGNDVWIGSHVMVMDGVKISTGAVVGTGSVVTKDVPPYAIVAGVPAKIIKYRHSQKDIIELLNSKWWDMNYNYIKSNIYTFAINKIDFNSNLQK